MSSRIILIGLSAVAVILLASSTEALLTLSTLKEQHAQLVSVFADYPVRSFAAYAVVLILLVSFSIPGTLFFMLFAGSAFKLSVAVPLIVACRAVGGVVAFLLGRHVARDWVRKRFGRAVAAIDQGVEREGWLYLAMLRLLPALPDSVINPGMGLTSMQLRTFFWVSVVGMIPYVVMYTIAGQQLLAMGSPSDAVSYPLLIGLSIFAVLLFLGKRFGDRMRVQND